MRVTLEEILDARDRRQARRQVLIAETGLPAVVLTVNMPGEVKSNEVSDYIFEVGTEAVCGRLLTRIAHFSAIDSVTGREAFFAVDIDDAVALKREMCEIEDGHPLGRLFDIDVYDIRGLQIGRKELGLNSRKCLLCDNDARVCARSRTHSVKELLRKISAIKEEYERVYD